MKDWLLNTSLYCIKVNKKFAASTAVRHHIEQEKEKLNKLKGVSSPKPDHIQSFGRKEGNQHGKNPINFTTEVPEQNEIDEAINSQFNITNK